ncbi:MAG: PilW family protein [Methyloversatilis discipulorum]|uniref:PilW family protein n=1 Tax=Methyloversatilis discipulorum TaxID=1119528 RepID=UPI0026F18032|nr:PilW family protein [Methyloversatilis discipulorum]MBT9517313.1 PilW family protein [Methyloversatilis discipulorum]
MSRHANREAGVSLVEVMIALALGLILSVGALSLMLGNRQAYSTTESLARVQEATRITFDLMSRDLRAAGINACSGGVRVMNLLRNPDNLWWLNWNDGLRGYDGNEASSAVTTGPAEGQRVDGTDMIEVMHGATTALPVKVHNIGGAPATLAGVNVPARSIALERPNGRPHGFVAGDLLVICDYEDTTIFQASGVDASANSVAHAAETGVPGNCSDAMGVRPTCTPGVTRIFQPGAQLMRFEPVAWYVGNNGRTGTTSSPTSLYRISIRSDGAGNASVQTEEVVEGVRDMQMRYMYDSDNLYRFASGTGTEKVEDWRLVTGIEIQLTIESPEAGTTTDASRPRLTRTLTHVVNLRNRVP